MNKEKAFEILGITDACNMEEIKMKYYFKSMELNRQLEKANEKAEWQDLLLKIKVLGDAYQMFNKKKTKPAIPKWKKIAKSIDAFLCMIEDSFMYKAILFLFKLSLALLTLSAIFL